MTVLKITFFHFYFLYLTEAYPSSEQISISITRHYKGDIFTLKGEKCYKDLCIGLSNGTAKPTEKSDCECKCVQNLPVFRDDLNVCVDDVHECSLVPFVSGTTVKKIPYVFLPLKGQIVYPSAEIVVSGTEAPVCVVSKGQFLGRNGWLNLRNNSGTEPPFRLFRDEGRTYLQWLGEISLRMAMEGRLILVHLMCKDASAIAEEPKIFTPCVAFRVAGNPSMREVLFATDVLLAEGYEGGLNVREYVVIGLSSLFLAVVYVASVFLYVRWRKKKQSKINKKKEEGAQLTLGEEGIIKNNPLLQASRHLNVCGEENGGFLTDSNSCCSDPDQMSDLLCLNEDDLAIHQNVQTSAIIHPCESGYGETNLNQDPNNMERLPEENVSIVETLEAKETNPEAIKAIVASNGRRKLYFNPSYFDPELLKAPPPAAIEFLMKIREVITIAKHKMSNKKFSPSLLGIPEEEGSSKTELNNQRSDFSADEERTVNGDDRRNSFPIKSTNCHRRPNEFYCPSDAKQKSIQKWLQDVPTMMRKDESKAKPKENWIKTTEEDKILSNPNFWQSNEPKANKVRESNKESAIRQDKKRPSTKTRPPPLPPQQLSVPLKEKTEKTIEEAEVEVCQRSNASPKSALPKSASRSDLISAMASLKPLPNDNKENETLPSQGKNRIQPHFAKNLMDAVIQELTDYKKNEKNLKTRDLSPQNQEESEIPKGLQVRNAGQRINGKTGDRNESESAGNRKSEQVSSNDGSNENKFIRAQKTGVAKKESPGDGIQDEHDYEVILLCPDRQIPGENNSRVHNLPEAYPKSERSEGYSLVSEVYVNDDYGCSSGKSSPSSLSVSSAENERISYEVTNEKIGRLTIQVKDSPKQQKDVARESDGFEPDTLERKQRKSKSVQKIGCGYDEEETYGDSKCQKEADLSENGEEFTDSLERPTIMLKTNGTFKRNPFERDVNELFRNLNWARMENFGSLREIYEAKNRNHKRRTETTSLVDSVNSDLDCMSTWSWGEERRNKLLNRGIVLHIDEDIDARRTRRFVQNKSHRKRNDDRFDGPSPVSKSKSASSFSPSLKLMSVSATPLTKNSSPTCLSTPSPPTTPTLSLPPCPSQRQSRSTTSSPIGSPDATSPLASSNQGTIVRVRPKNECGTHYQTINLSVSQPSSLPASMPSASPRPAKVSVDDRPPLPPRSLKPPLPPNTSKGIRQESDSGKYGSRPLPPLPFPRPGKEPPSPTASYKDPETLSNASADSLNSSEYKTFYSIPYDAEVEENGCKDDSDSIGHRVNGNESIATVVSTSVALDSTDAVHHQKNQRRIQGGDCKKSRPRGKDDSGYLSTDSSESYCPRSVLPSGISQRHPESNLGGQNGSETDESICDGASESGAESTATDSFFYGNFKRPQGDEAKGSSENSESHVSSYTLRLSDVEVNSDTERHCMPILVRP